MADKKIPDAWDDDWEAQADKIAQEEEVTPEDQGPMTRAERLAKHEQANKKIWESAYVC